MPDLAQLNALLLAAGLSQLSPDLSERFSSYRALLAKWNGKLNLTGIRSADEVLRRHLVECIFCAEHLPDGIHTLLDFGSGAGFPGIPIALCRPEIAVTLADSNIKKAGFLQEAVRVLGLSVTVYSGRVEDLPTLFDAVTMRAVDKMDDAIPIAVSHLLPGGTLALMVSTASHIGSRYRSLRWLEPLPLPESAQRVLLLGKLGT